MKELPKKKHQGSKTTYRKEYVQVVEDLFDQKGSALSGTDLSKTFRVSVATIYNWRTKYPEFRHAIDAGRDFKNVEVVENELLKNCKDRWVSETTENFNKKGELNSKSIRTRLIPGDVTAQKFFLMSRDPRYSNVLEESTVSGGKPVQFDIIIGGKDGKGDKKEVRSGTDTGTPTPVGRSSTRH